MNLPKSKPAYQVSCVLFCISWFWWCLLFSSDSSAQLKQESLSVPKALLPLLCCPSSWLSFMPCLLNAMCGCHLMTETPQVLLKLVTEGAPSNHLCAAADPNRHWEPSPVQMSVWSSKGFAHPCSYDVTKLTLITAVQNISNVPCAYCSFSPSSIPSPSIYPSIHTYIRTYISTSM